MSVVHTVTLNCFAKARELVNNTQISVNIRDNSNVQELQQQIAAQYPTLKIVFLQSCKFAQNNKYINSNIFRVTESCELTLIPPISGG